MRFGNWRSCVMGVVAVAMLAVSGAGCDSDDGSSELAITGSYVDGFGGKHEVAAETWVQTSDFGEGPKSSTFHLTQHDNGKRWVVGQNDEANEFSPSKWSRFDWVTTGAKLYFCQTTYDAATEAAALAATPADSADLANGCNGFAWSELTPVAG